MRRILIAAALLVAAAGCSSTRPAHPAGPGDNLGGYIARHATTTVSTCPAGTTPGYLC